MYTTAATRINPDNVNTVYIILIFTHYICIKCSDNYKILNYLGIICKNGTQCVPLSISL